MTDSKENTVSPDLPCRQCACSGRRDFLRESVGLLGGVLLSLGIAPDLAALTLREVEAHRAATGEWSYPLPPADGVNIDREHQVILARYHGMIYAFALSCPHQNTALHWLDQDQVFQCPKHKSRYQPDGTFISGRATRNMDRLPIRLEGTQLLVDVDRVFESDKDAAGWAAAEVKL